MGVDLSGLKVALAAGRSFAYHFSPREPQKMLPYQFDRDIGVLRNMTPVLLIDLIPGRPRLVRHV